MSLFFSALLRYFIHMQILLFLILNHKDTKKFHKIRIFSKKAAFEKIKHGFSI